MPISAHEIFTKSQRDFILIRQSVACDVHVALADGMKSCGRPNTAHDRLIITICHNSLCTTWYQIKGT